MLSRESRGAVSSQIWERVADQGSPSWYLDPLVAAQKRTVNLSLLDRWTRGDGERTILKTDLFEEANGPDEILTGCDPTDRLIGMDVSIGEAVKARRRCSEVDTLFIVMDVRRLALAAGSIDVVFSNSTLDHFETHSDLDRSLGELARALRPGGTAIITLDNIRNPLYWLLRMAAKAGWSPFPLGVTTSLGGLVAKLQGVRLEISETDYLIHNPRAVSTVLFLTLRRVLGRKADWIIGLLLDAFALLDRLPTRSLTACFVAARAVKPPSTALR